MAIWWILGSLALLILLILCLRVGVEFLFGEEMHVIARVGPAKITIFPRIEKKVETKEPPKKKEKKEKREKNRQGESGSGDF